MGPRLDSAWLESVRDRMASGEPCGEEVRTFLRSVRPFGLAVVGRMRKDAAASGHADDILAIAAHRFASRGIALYRGNGSPQAYYAGIVAKVTHSYFRKKSWSEALRDPASLEDEPSARVPAEAERKDLARDLSAALLALYETHPTHADAVYLYYWAELGSDAVCAEHVGAATPEAFRKQRERGLAILRRFLENGGYE